MRHYYHIEALSLSDNKKYSDTLGQCKPFLTRDGPEK